MQIIKNLENKLDRLEKVIDDMIEEKRTDESHIVHQLKEEEFNYDVMYQHQVVIENITELTVKKQMAHIFWGLIYRVFRHNESIMDIYLPSFMLDTRGLLEVLSDFIQPSLLVEIPQGKTAEERMLRTLKFYLAGLSKMRGFEGTAKRPLSSMKGEVFRCMWKTSANRQDEIAGSQCQNWFGVAETYFVQQWKKQMLLKPKKIKEMDAAHLPSSMVGKAYLAPPIGQLDNDDDKMVTFLAEQVSTSPPISTFYAECDFNQVYLRGTIETTANLEWVCNMNTCINCSFFDKVLVHSKGDITLTLGEYCEDYVFTLPVNKVKHARSKPQVDFHDSIRITCVRTGYHCAIRFLPASYGEDRFQIKAYMYHGNKGPLLYRVDGHWNGVMSVKKEENDAPSAMFCSARDIFHEAKIMRSINDQADFESRKIWKNVVRGIVTKHWDLADKHREKIKMENMENPMKLKYFQRSGGEYMVKRQIMG